MAKLQVVVCDECKSLTKATRRYQIRRDGSTVNVDLCADDSKALDKLIDAHGAASSARTPFEKKVSTVEEIEARKAGKAGGK
jgi:hypothetical protein